MATNGEQWAKAATWRTAERSEYKYQWAKDQLVRMVVLPPVESWQEIFDYLNGEHGAENLTVDGRALTGDWRTLRVWLNPIGPETDGAKRTVGLYHALTLGPSDAADTAYVTEDGCAYRVEVTPYQRRETLASVPAGTSGVFYRIVGEQRDRETGWWSFAIEKRTRKVQTTGAVTLRDDAFSTVTEQTWLGVREDGTDEDGNAVAVWAVGVDAPGTLTECAGVSKNEDCTHNVTMRRTVAKAVTGEVYRKRTAFRDIERVTLKNQPERVDAYVNVTGGVITERWSTPNADGTFDNVQQTSTAIAGQGALSYERTAFRQVATVRMRAQAAPVAAFVDVAGGVITTQSAEPNEDGTWDNAETLSTAIAGEGAVSYEQTAFRTVVTVRMRNQTERATALVAVAGGVITTVGGERNENDLWDNFETLSTAVAGIGAVSYERTAFRDVVTVRMRNQTTRATAVVEVSGGVITTQGGERNENDLWDNFETLNTARQGVGSVRRRKTTFGTVVSITNRNETEAVDAFADVSGGIITERYAERNENDVWDNTETLTAELTGSRERKTSVGYLDSTEQTVDVEAEAPDDAEAVAGAVVTVADRITEAGNHEVTRLVKRAGVLRAIVNTLTYTDGYTETTVVLYNADAEDVAGFYATYGDGHKAVPGLGFDDTGKMYGSIRFTPNVGEFVTNAAFETGSITENECSTVEIKGVCYKRTVSSTYYLKKGHGIESGASAYAAGETPLSGSDFKELGGDWYMFKKVTEIVVTHEEIDDPVNDEIKWGGE